MYDLSGSDTDREWIEVYNAGAADIDLSEIKFFEANTNHGLVPVGGSTLATGAFAIIASNPANFVVDWPDFSGLIFDSSFSLSNTGEDLAMKDKDGNILDQISYDSSLGAAGDEKSLQREGDDFTAAAPTPGAGSESDPPPDEEDPGDEEPAEDEPADDPAGDDAGGGSSNDEPAPKTALPKKPAFSIKIDLPTHAIANSDFLVSAILTGVEENLPSKYVWNFGNGEVIEIRHNKPFGYIYQFPGIYVITLNYFKDDYAKPVRATAKIKVEENPVSVSRILPDGSVEIKNSATHQVDLSGWVLKSGLISFTLPSETSLMAGSSVIFPAKVTHFSPSISGAELIYPSGTPASALQKSASKIYLDTARPSNLGAELPSEEVPVEPEITGTNLSASVVNSMEDNNSSSILPWILGLGGIILVSSIASFFIFSGKSTGSSDFKITE